MCGDYWAKRDGVPRNSSILLKDTPWRFPCTAREISTRGSDPNAMDFIGFSEGIVSREKCTVKHCFTKVLFFET